MVQSIYDTADYQHFYNIQPIRRINNEFNGYDLIAWGTRLGVGFVEAGELVDRPQFDLDVRGKVRCHELFMVSDAREKAGIAPVTAEDCHELVRRMGVREFALVRDGADAAPKYGLVAQELEQLSPRLVRTAADGGKSIDLSQIVALLCGAVQRLSAEVEELRGRGPTAAS